MYTYLCVFGRVIDALAMSLSNSLGLSEGSSNFNTNSLYINHIRVFCCVYVRKV